MKIYKVVKRVDDVLKSAVVFNNEEFCLVYEVGTLTSAPAGLSEAWPFAFKTLEQAEEFLDRENVEQDMEIYLAETELAVDIYDCAIDLGDMLPFWQDRNDPELTMQAPDGTVMCNRIILLERVQ